MWKNIYEKEEQVHFVKRFGGKKVRSGRLIYFYCFRSGKHCSRSKGIRNVYKSIKTNNLCTAEIKLILRENGAVTLKMCSTHYGHGNSLPFLRLTGEEKKRIACSLEKKIEVSVILENIRNDMLSRENISRIHLTTRQDIKNIKRSFGLTNQRHADDATSVRLMLEEMAELGADNPILGCKFQGCLSSEYEGLNNEDFFLAIQHPLQKEMLKKFGKEIVCVDSTHGTNSYNFKLITVLVVDDFGEGFPVAWCISNREDFTALRKFFLLLKNNTETSITFNFFMSDDAPAFYNSWSDVFDFPGKKLLCYFHFDKAIRKKIEVLIKNKMKACEVYKAISILFSETNEQIFRKMFEKFLNNLKEDSDTEGFYHYFLNKYNNREKEIAMCFRNGCKIRTNNHLESYHRDLKYNYLSGKVNKRLDFCLYKLMEFVKDKGCKRIVKLERGKISSKKKSIELRHAKSLNLDVSLIQKESNNSFIVKGSRSNYNVELSESKCPMECHLRCSKCLVCIHEVKCSCLDNVLNGLICKHAHLVCRTQKVSKKSHDNLTSVSEEIASVHKILAKPWIAETSITELSQSTDNLLEEIRSQISNLDQFKYKEKIMETKRMLKNINNFLKIEEPELGLPIQNPANNKNVIQQRSFFSTKKERKISSHLTKPSFEEMNNIREALLDDDDVTIPEFNHQAYCLQSQVNEEVNDPNVRPAKKRKLENHKYFILNIQQQNILKHILNKNVSGPDFQNKGLFSEDDLKNDNEITDSIINYDLTSIQKLFTTEAWEELQKKITIKQNFWRCNHCQSSTTLNNMVQCDDCCHWYHWKCVNFKNGSKIKNWLCPNCSIK
ncbi:uncharacterized protein TNCT_333491 [Trichonephila clavata]|uniref:Uncharacterized protein n=1 Tax=Trichonephila clavata TaxID=2740835 RepID=A0A8X6KMT9_TRICU|nr:uncharacterized protein TNCT_333491 [Trichonephila clavata]